MHAFVYPRQLLPLILNSCRMIADNAGYDTFTVIEMRNLTTSR